MIGVKEAEPCCGDVPLGIDWLRGGVRLLLWLLFLPPVPPGAPSYLTPLFPVGHVSCQSVFTTSANLKSQLLDHFHHPKVGEVAPSVSLSPGHVWSLHPL